ncbi:hypothetical protein F511_15714 [Dorcoceras hygrometricum]|uniref:Uncharacterized protein n=1 Tax=Dorcoceras hygrometricum TaxID=472368 RepID=A0A2Z7BKK1_9LAMI|nr:hypothetical protein F511_15714 [Dorcoceras hygrometricum]
MKMDGLPGELSSYPRLDSPSGYHLSSGESEALVHSRCRYSDLQDVCMTIESLTTLDLPMVIGSIGIYELKGPYYTLTMTDWCIDHFLPLRPGSGIRIRRCANSGIRALARICQYIEFCLNSIKSRFSKKKNFPAARLRRLPSCASRTRRLHLPLANRDGDRGIRVCIPCAQCGGRCAHLPETVRARLCAHRRPTCASWSCRWPPPLHRGARTACNTFAGGGAPPVRRFRGRDAAAIFEF